jgi:hypothetical protein
VKNNTIVDIATLNQTRPGTGVALRPNFGGNNSAAEVADNSFSELDIAVTHPAGDTVEIDRSELATVVVSPDGTEQRIFTPTIQNAINAASTNDTIRVGPGEFQGPVQIVDGQTNLTIESIDGPESTVINATGTNTSTTPSFNAQAVRISADGVTIDGFTIVGDDAIVSGVFVAGGEGGGDNVQIVNNTIEGMSQPGFGGPSDNSAGIVTATGGNGTVGGLVARNNTIRDIGSTAKKQNNPDRTRNCTN